jgi:hypothetical protein
MMADATRVAQGGWRTIVFRILAALTALFFVTNLRLVPGPWLAQGAPDFRQWSDAMTVAIAMLTVGSLVAVIWRPLKMPLPLQYLAIATVLAVIEIAPFEGPYIFFVVVPLVVVVAAVRKVRSAVRCWRSACWPRSRWHRDSGSRSAGRYRARAVTG